MNFHNLDDIRWETLEKIRRRIQYTTENFFQAWTEEIAKFGSSSNVSQNTIMETLGKLFGSEAKVKIIRLFLFSPETVFDVSTIANRVKEDVSKVRREMSVLEKIEFVKRRVKVNAKSGTKGFILNQNFEYITSLQNFLLYAKPLDPREMIKKFSAVGSVKLIIVSGIFTHNADSRVDLLIVGDNFKKAPLEHLIKNLEAEIGKELRYAYFDTNDFHYRFNMYDKLVRDILDYPHEKLVNKLAFL